jgi:hypothetical protein
MMLCLECDRESVILRSSDWKASPTTNRGRCRTTSFDNLYDAVRENGTDEDEGKAVGWLPAALL